MGDEGGVERDRAARGKRAGTTMMNDVRPHQADAGVMVLGVVPIEEGLAGGSQPSHRRRSRATTTLTAGRALCTHSGARTLAGRATAPGKHVIVQCLGPDDALRRSGDPQWRGRCSGPQRALSH